MQFGTYTLDCCCDTHNCNGVEPVNPTRVTGENASECRMKARRIGWSFVRNKCFCPKCTRAKREAKAARESEGENG